MNTANTNTTATLGEATCNAMSGGGGTQEEAVPREPWWEEVGRLVDAFEAELVATTAAKTGAGTTH
ncbi:hypothetical protein [Rhodoferax sp.]|uniref:hypothetical protein n=1 Tax=Rhodoferax sp. TaxID=50421 RepID=UPI00275118A6|nr:hypothetical protein [Rhodoferax sp.]